MSKSIPDNRPLHEQENVVPDHTREMGTTVPPHGHDHEYQDISFGAIWRFVVVLAVTIAASQLAIWGVFEILEARAESTDAERPPLSTPAPMPRTDTLQSMPRRDMAHFRHMEDSVLSTYAWVDQQAGVAKIPIDVAMELALANVEPAAMPEPVAADDAAATEDATAADDAATEDAAAPTAAPSDGH